MRHVLYKITCYWVKTPSPSRMKALCLSIRRETTGQWRGLIFQKQSSATQPWKPEDTRHFINFESYWASNCREICNGQIWKHLKGSGYGLFELSRYLPSYRVKKRQTWVLNARDLNLALSAYDVALRVSTEPFADGICGRDWKADRPVTITDTKNLDTVKSVWPIAQRKPFVWPVTNIPHIVKKIRTGRVPLRLSESGSTGRTRLS